MELLSLPTSPQISSPVEFGASEGSLWLDASCPQDLQALLSHPYPDSIKMSKSQRTLKGHKTCKNWNLSPRLKSWNLPVAVLFKHHSPRSLEVLLFLPPLKHHKMKPIEPSSCSRFHLTLKQNIIGRVGRLYQLPKAVLGDTFPNEIQPGTKLVQKPWNIFSREIQMSGELECGRILARRFWWFRRKNVKICKKRFH